MCEKLANPTSCDLIFPQGGVRYVVQSTDDSNAKACDCSETCTNRVLCMAWADRSGLIDVSAALEQTLYNLCRTSFVVTEENKQRLIRAAVGRVYNLALERQNQEVDDLINGM